MSVNLNTVMDALGVRLRTITGLRVHDYPAETVSPPAAVVGLPSEVQYDFTMGRGSDRVVIPVAVLVGRVVDRSARDRLSEYLAGSGTRSIKAAIEAGEPGQTARVTGARVEWVTIGAVEYLGATFDVEIVD